MIANVSAHRRANAFAQALEEQELQGEAAARTGPPADDAGQGKLLTLAGGLSQLPAPELDPEVRTVQRAQLIAAMEAQFAGGGAATVPEPRRAPGDRAAGRGAHRANPLSRLKPRSRWSKGLAAGGLTVGVAAGALGGVAAASSNALPGDTLYGLKRGMEDLKYGMADSDSERGGILLDQASTRFHEARRLMERGRSGHLDHESLGEIRRTLSGMRQDVSEGHRLLRAAYERDGSLGPLKLLSTFNTSHREGWSQLRDRLPLPLNDVRDQVSSAFRAIDDEIEPLQSLLQGHDRHPAHGKGGAPARSGAPGSPSHGAPSPHRSSGGGKHATDRPAQPSTGSQEEQEGLLGGTGLLRPASPSESQGQGQSPSGTPRGKDGKPSKQPDVIIPPLLPDILPGLGIHGEDQR
ncbi:hypothetical protein I5Q34_12085 [Streptomyces sp. AV19]|uniref:DUF5667 domain-containing protein n=1 Tax=Streptomyces sp. AV19 TaxID=2793068 RepID=UPI0018FE4372|nr:DUF5667 domain-containing protein [Streptomyces sp. AV19]MBH1935006.1 hypothetical protein [Streptomyces sp. AV19]MDG4530939.1 DUF5667 domain-containing protein [Streptomyces sp. AV19]